MKKRVVQYDSLVLPISSAEKYSYQPFSLSWYGLVLVGIFILMAGIYVYIAHEPDSYPGIDAAVTGVIGLGFATAATIYYARRVAKARRIAKTARFAAINHYGFRALVKNPDYAGMMFGVGNSREIESVMRIPAEKASYEIGNYAYAVGYSSARESFRYGYIRIRQQRQLPHVVLISTTHKLRGPFRNILTSFKRQQKLGLEGNFNQYFMVYAPQKYEADALYILTPDVMASLIDTVHHYDIELVNNELYIYRDKPFNLNDRQDIIKALEICDTVGKEIDHQTDYYADQKIDDRSIDMVSTQGFRLKQTPDWLITVYVAYLIVDGLLIKANIHTIGVAQLITGGAAFIGLVVTVLERVQRLQANKKTIAKQADKLSKLDK